MRYTNIKKAVFLDRPNRFIANILLDGKPLVCHVKNTGRCRELLIRGTVVYLAKGSNPQRKTAWDLVGVKKGARLINMDSQAPNAVVAEAIPRLFPDATYVKAERVFGDSRFDFYIETATRRIFMEVKGVTLEEDGVVRFPDAPTERGVKHLRELTRCMEEGYEAWVLFVIQMENVKYFASNDETHPAFGEALRLAAEKGVRVLAYDCRVSAEELHLGEPVEVRL